MQKTREERILIQQSLVDELDLVIYNLAQVERQSRLDLKAIIKKLDIIRGDLKLLI